MFSKDKIKFIAKVTIAHVITYAIVTIIAIPRTLNYIDSAVELMGMKPLDEINIGVVLIGQIIRGLLCLFPRKRATILALSGQ